jgi:hypothetical protein
VTAVGTIAALTGVAGAGSPSVSTIAALHAAAKPAASALAVEGVPRASHVFVIVGENTSLRQLTVAHAPFIAGALKTGGAWLVGYRALAKSSSLGDYIEMTSGQSIKCERNNSLPVNLETDKAICHQDVKNIFHQLQARHISWTDWEQSMPHPCAFFDDGTDWAGDVYSVHHNPAIYYDNVEGHRYVEDFAAPPKALCRAHDLPMGTTARNDTSAFDAALADGSISRFNFIVPNDCENSHDPCGSSDPGHQFDAFVQREVSKIEASPAWDSRSVIDITWDEQGDGTPHDRSVGSVWVGPQVKPGVYSGHWSHDSLLRTLEDQFGLAHIHRAQTAPVIGTIWR